MNDHYSKHYNSALDAIRSRVLEMGGLVESQVSKALIAMEGHDQAALETVIADDKQVNEQQISIDSELVEIIARRQPAAKDLRVLITVSRMITDLERVGDEAKKIAMTTLRLNEPNRGERPAINLRHVGSIVLSMLQRALDAFARLDISAVSELAHADQRVDEAFHDVILQLTDAMGQDSRSIQHSIEILFIAKAIERIGDHTKNLAEHVVYLVEGRDVRHTHFIEKSHSLPV